MPFSNDTLAVTESICLPLSALTEPLKRSICSLQTKDCRLEKSSSLATRTRSSRSVDFSLLAAGCPATFAGMTTAGAVAAVGTSQEGCAGPAANALTVASKLKEIEENE